MSLVLNTNTNALIAQGNLTTSGNQLANALQQLSSGLRINTAADDSAGYAIAQGMTSQVNGLNQASQNANDGVSLAQTAAGALQEVTNDLQTMRDLAVESLNATNSTQDRQDLNTQFQQLLSDINNVAANTQFNGVNLLDGSFNGMTFQVGANVGQTIEVSTIASAAAGAIGNVYTSSAGTGISAATDGAVAGDTGTFTVTVANAAGTTTASVTTAGVTFTGNTATDQASIAAAINQAVGSNSGVVATVNKTTGAIDLSTSGTAAQTVSVAFTAGKNATTGAADDAGTSTAAGVVGATYTLGSAAAGTTGSAFLSTLDVTSVDNSNLVLISIDNALQQMATSGANLGAYQNRFQAAISGLNIDSTNLTAAKSAIVDTDYAQQTSALSKAQILQQAGTAMVAQANTIPQNILTLLQKLP